MNESELMVMPVTDKDIMEVIPGLEESHPV
jgi:hypothetical protein